jgi:hypothetical protein
MASLPLAFNRDIHAIAIAMITTIRLKKSTLTARKLMACGRFH